MPGRSGLDLLETIKRMHPATILLVLTANRSVATMAEAKRRGASSYLTKPADINEIASALDALGKHGSERM
jgi:ActR/RegA family two-component response regulator